MNITSQTGVDFLEHFGKKGMRWGVRNKQPISTSNNRKMKRGKKAADDILVQHGSVVLSFFDGSKKEVSIKRWSDGTEMRIEKNL